jgi:hypothetical protein
MQTPDLIMSRLPYRGFASRIFSPFEGQLALMGDKMPFAFAMFDSASMVTGGVVVGLDTQVGYVSQPDGCYVTHLVASATEGAGSFAFQVYDAERQKLWSPSPIIFGLGCGSAGEPFWLKKLYRLPANGQLQCQVSNLVNVNNTIQVVAWGLRD